MQISRSSNPHDSVGYFPLSNGKVDVFLRRNEKAETDDEGNTVYVAEEVYFQVEESVTKKQIETDFNHYWNRTQALQPNSEERLEAIESTLLALMME